MPDDAGQNPGEGHWLGSLSEDLTFEVKGEDGTPTAVPAREHPKLLEFKDKGLDEFAKSYLEAQNVINRRAMTALPKDATDEQKAEFEKQFRGFLQVPEKPEDYTLTLPEDSVPDEKMMNWFKGAAHKIGLSPTMAQTLLSDYQAFAEAHWQELEQAEAKQEEARRAEVQANMVKTYGSPEKAKEAAELSKRGFSAVAKLANIDEAATQEFLKVHGDDPTMIAIFKTLGETLKEDQFVSGQGGKGLNDGKSVAQRVYPNMNP